VRRRRQRAGDVHVRHGRRQSPHATAISGRRRRTSGREGRPTISGSGGDVRSTISGSGYASRPIVPSFRYNGRPTISGSGCDVRSTISGSGYASRPIVSGFGYKGRPTVSGSSYDEVAAREGCGIEPTAVDRIRGIAIQQFGSKDRREMAVNLILPITLVVRLDQSAHRACSYINKRVRAMTFKINDL